MLKIVNRTKFARNVFKVGLLISALATYSLPAHGATAQYEYDVRGRLIKVTWSSGKVVTYTYDAAGNRTTVVLTP